MTCLGLMAICGEGAFRFFFNLSPKILADSTSTSHHATYIQMRNLKSKVEKGSM